MLVAILGAILSIVGWGLFFVRAYIIGYKNKGKPTIIDTISFAAGILGLVLLVFTVPFLLV